MRILKLWKSPIFILSFVLLIALTSQGCKEESKKGKANGASGEVSKKIVKTGEGKKLFNSKGCVGCHTFGQGDRVGPDLKGVTKRRSKDWLAKWIADPTGMLKTDKIAKELLKKYKTPMPKVPLSKKEVASLIGYLEGQDKGTVKMAAFKPLSKSEYEKGKNIFFDRCSGCHGAKRWGATGPSLLPTSHIAGAKEVSGGGTRSKGTEALEAILTNGTSKGMPAWGKEGILDKRQINLMARYVQMPPPPIPKLDMAEIRKNWKLIVPVKDRPKTDQSGGKYKNYFGVVLRDAGKCAIIDGDTKEKIAILGIGKATHILRSSHSGRYFYAIGRDGRVFLIDLWFKIPKVVAKSRSCWDARSVDSSKAPGYEDKYALVGCYTPGQYAIMDGETLEPISLVSVADSKDWSTGNVLPEVRVAAVVASEKEPFWVANLKESGWVYLIDYTNPKKPKETRIKAENFLHDGGWVNIPGTKEKRYLVMAANAKNTMVIIDTKTKKMIKKVKIGKIPHPGRGANFVHPKYGPVFATTYIGDNKLTFIGVDPKGHPDYAWKSVENHKIKSVGSLFVKTHPKSNHVWFDMPLSNDKGVNGQAGVYNIKTGKITYITVSPKRIVHFEYNAAGNEVWISGWAEGAIYVYDDKTLKLIKKITGDWVKTPTGKFNVTNTSKDIY